MYPSWLNRIRNLRSSVTYGVGLFTALGAASLAFIGYRGKGAGLLLLGLVLVAAALAAYIYLIRLAEKRKAARFGQSMSGHGAGAPQQLHRAEQIAKLDDMRKKFQEGVTTFVDAGKDLYSMPWYVMVGEPGSGKTEAIRHSSIGFPPGLQDEMQGVGGTINMNWWFTNQAVILDLAGRTVFEEVRAGENSDWTEFLRLLLANRPSCPINGLFLVIPADSLIKDSLEEIKRKGGIIARQLDTVQRTLDVRFPVFVLVTKCDLINGFREFFDGIQDPQVQQQMLGWSNPALIDEPFQPEQVQEHIEVVHKELLRHRLRLLRDPTPTQDFARSRFDEVDTLFDFPSSFSGLLPALQRYLEQIFVSGEWSAKPLFLRGIYFTSSMREGAAIDKELAQVLGVAPEELPEGTFFEKERSFFLRDLFLRKAFVEKGLVTRATNVNQLHQRRKRIMLASGIGGVLVLMGLTWFGARSLDRGIGRELDLWRVSARELPRVREPDAWLRIVRPDRPDPRETKFLYGGRVRIGVAESAGRSAGRETRGGRQVSLVQLHGVLSEYVEEPIRIPVVFRMLRPFGRDFYRQRQDAYRLLAEESILRPVVLAARHKMLNDPPDARWAEPANLALNAMIRLNANAEGLVFDQGRRSREDDMREWLDLDPFFRYVLVDDIDLYGQEAWLYREIAEWLVEHAEADRSWPWPDLATGGRLAQLPALSNAVDRFLLHAADTPARRELEALVQQCRQGGDFPALDRETRNVQNARQEYAAFLRENLRDLQRLSGFVAVEPAWERWAGELALALEDQERAVARTDEMRQGIGLLLAADLNAEVSNRVASIRQDARIRSGELQLPARQLRGEEIGTTLDPTFADDIRVRVDAWLAGLDTSLVTPDDLAVCLELKRRLTENQPTETIRSTDTWIQPVRLPDELRPPDFPTWREFKRQIEELDVRKRQDALRDFSRAVHEGFRELAEVGLVEPDLAAELLKVAGQSLQKARDLDEETRWDRVLRKWKRLVDPDTPMQVRERILAADAKEFAGLYLNLRGPVPSDFVSQHWLDFYRAGLSVLARECMDEARTSKAALERFGRFPLSLPGRGRSLDRSQFAEARSVIQSLPAVSVAPGGKRLGEGAPIGVEAVDEVLTQLRTLDMEGPLALWVGDAKRLMDVLPAAGRAEICKVQLLPSPQQVQLRRRERDEFKAADSLWRTLRIEQGGVRGREISTLVAEEFVSLGEISYPGDRSVFRFFQADRRDTVFGIDDPWGCLRMLHDLRGVERLQDGKAWLVPIRLPSDLSREEERDMVIWFRFEFDKPLPALNDWPRFPEEDR